MHTVWLTQEYLGDQNTDVIPSEDDSLVISAIVNSLIITSPALRWKTSGIQHMERANEEEDLSGCEIDSRDILKLGVYMYSWESQSVSLFLSSLIHSCIYDWDWAKKRMDSHAHKVTTMTLAVIQRV